MEWHAAAAEKPDRTNHARLLEIIDYRLALNPAEPFCIAISGPSGSGKSTFARELMTNYQNSAVLIDTDSYYIGKTAMQRQLSPEGRLDFDSPLACNLPLLASHLQSLKRGQTIKKPNYDMLHSEPFRTYTVLSPRPLIIIEGIFASQPIVHREVDLSVCLMASFKDRLARRVERDRTRKGYSPETTEQIMKQSVEPSYQRFISAADQAADLIIYR